MSKPIQIDSDDVFVVSEKRQRSDIKRDQNQLKRKEIEILNSDLSEEEKRRKELLLHTSDSERTRNIIGPAYFSAGFIGLLEGLRRSTKEVIFKNRPPRLIMTSMLNIVSRHVYKFANAGGCLCLLFTLTRKGTDYFFEEELAEMTYTQKNIVYGFMTGFFFKSSRGLKPALLGGTLFGGFLYLYTEVSLKGHVPKI